MRWSYQQVGNLTRAEAMELLKGITVNTAVKQSFQFKLANILSLFAMRTEESVSKGNTSLVKLGEVLKKMLE